jgi:hypothetical protein
MKIAIIGVGTAGIQTIAYLLGKLPSSIEIVSIHNPQIKILGIGESTTAALPHALWRGCEFTMAEDSTKLDSTTKHGVKYINWTEEPFYTHILPPYYAMHFNNFKLGDVVLEKAAKKWPNRFSKIEGTISNIIQDEKLVTVTVDSTDYNFDYVVDCRGYPEDYTDYYISQDLPVNHCLVNTISQPGDWNYTYHQAHRNGWMFGIPLKTRQGWGYLYNDTITEKAEAIDEIAEIFKTTPDELNLREFAFKNYYANTFIDNRIFKNGNRALFFEPLEALSGYFYEAVCVEITKVVFGESTVDESNKTLTVAAQRYEDFICFVYHGGSVFDTPFWRATKEKTIRHLANSPHWAHDIKSMKMLSVMNQDDERIIIGPASIFLWNLLDKKMNYRYFND